jgi:hypothetical protein
MDAAQVIEIDERRRTARSRPEDAEIVAVVLADGSVRDLREGEIDRPEHDFEAGQVGGEGWTLWWQRRAW